ncbi:MAG: adenylate/guanylate cyclase domain-containing protein [Chloroflexi bacterium]|nr:adenylate/guanylate cyclase domain-containing protein [Chloroflexota bacterium]
MRARRLRLWSGLVLYVFVATHLLNHALGLISLRAAEDGRLIFLAVWRNPPGTALLIGALLVHVGLVLWALYQQRHLRLPRWEIVRITLGLAMPLLLVPHLFGTMVLARAFDVQDTYAYVVVGMWALHPSSAVIQSLLVVIAWTHGCMGVHWWLRFKPWYPRYLPTLRAAALLLPTLALLGFAEMGKETAALANQPGWLAQTFAGITDAQEQQVQDWATVANGAFVAAVVLVFAARYARQLWQRRRGVVRLNYPGGRRIEIAAGTSVLEASRAAGIPHASLCGGRGRCSTCRSRIGPPSAVLPPPSSEEARVLRRVGAPPNVRLACQLRPTADVTIVPLLPPTVETREGFLRPSYTQGSEQDIAILFADLRGFTQFAEHRLPYDVVFVLNQYFKAMGEAVEQSGGHLDKFIGDGVMALFGVSGGPRDGCREALDAAVAMAQALDELNRALVAELAEPLRIGIGIHTGHAIVGEMGYGRARSLTAIGDAVNTASRLESMTKEYHCQVIVTDEVASLGGVNLSAFDGHEIEVRGRTTPLTIRVIPSALDLIPVLSPSGELRAASGEV